MERMGWKQLALGITLLASFPLPWTPKYFGTRAFLAFPAFANSSVLWCMWRVTNPRWDILGSCRWQRQGLSHQREHSSLTWGCSASLDCVQSRIELGSFEMHIQDVPVEHSSSWWGVVEDYAIPFSCRTFVGCSGLMYHRFINSDVVFYFYTASLCNSAIFHCISWRSGGKCIPSWLIFNKQSIKRCRYCAVIALFVTFPMWLKLLEWAE